MEVTPPSAVRQIFGEEARRLGRMLAIYGLLGVIAGLAAVAFKSLVLASGEHLLYALTAIDPSARGEDAQTAGLSAPSGTRWWLLALPAGGGLLAGLLCAFFAPEVMGPGTGSVIEAYHRRGGQVRGRVPFVEAIASALVIGTGGSAGIEGPVGHVAGGLGVSMGRLLRLSAPERRIVLMAGFAAGIGAVFHAPMAASIFAAEVLYRELDMEHEVLVPAIIASTIAYAVYGAVHGWDPIWTVPPVAFGGLVELVPYLGLAVLVAGAGYIFTWMMDSSRRYLGRNERIPLWLRPALGGLGVGLVGLWLPSATGVGYGMAQTAIDGGVGVLIMLLLALAKMATSSLTMGSGAAGGVFAPSLVIGSCLGGAVALLTNQLVPALDVSPAAFAIVGMAGFFATVISAPLSTVIMVSEVVGSYHLLVPTLWVCTLAWLLGRGNTLYEEAVPSRMEAPGHLSDMMDAVLRRITVKEALTPGKSAPVTVPPSLGLRDLVHTFASTEQAVFPIVDPRTGQMEGVVDGRQLRRTVGEQGIDDLLLANDFRAPALVVAESETLHDAVTRMTATGYDDILVVADADPTVLRGVMSRREIVSAYHRKMLKRAPEVAPEPAAEASEAGPPDLVAALERGRVLYGIHATTRDGVLHEMVEQAGLPDDAARARLLALLQARERLGTTAIGDGVALPHPDTTDIPGIASPRVVMALLKRPVPWGDAPDAPPVETVCLLLAPSGEAHLALLGQLARTLSDPAMGRLLRQRASSKRLVKRAEELIRPRPAGAEEA